MTVRSSISQVDREYDPAPSAKKQVDRGSAGMGNRTR
jgi:hypothetical protein